MFKPAREKRQKPDLVNGVEKLTRGEDINTLAIVGEVSPLVTQGRSPNGNGLFGGGGRLSAGVPVVVTGSDGEVHARVDGSVDAIIQSDRLATTQKYVCEGTLVPCLSSGSVFSLGCSVLAGSLFSSPHNTANDTSYGTTPVGTQDLDGNEVTALATPDLREPTVPTQWVRDRSCRRRRRHSEGWSFPRRHDPRTRRGSR